MLRTSFRTLRAVVHFVAVIAAALFLGIGIVPEIAAQSCQQTVVAQVVALDQPFMLNRLGSAMPQGMVFALKRDVVDIDSGESCTTHACQAGHVTLRRDKRPRPLVLRVNQGQCLSIQFTNLLDTQATNVLEPVTREAGVHLTGLELLDINADATWAGSNKSSLANPGRQLTYNYFAKEEGTFLLYSAGGDWGGQLQSGLFGAVNVEPPHAEWYRSQVTHDDLMLSAFQVGDLAKRNEAPVPDMARGTLRRQFSAPGKQLTAEVDHQQHEIWKLTNVEPDRQTIHTTQVAIINNHLFALDGRPLVDYNAVYPAGHAHAGQPILKMYETHSDGSIELIYSDLTAIITGPNADRFPYSEVGPRFVANPALPDRRQPFREITVVYHEAFAAVQAFSQFYDPGYAGAFGVVGSGAGADQFAINYGAAGITAEVLANRLGVGPMGNKDAADLKFEEFFLSSWANGDPAMLVDVPANANNQQITNPAQKSQITQQFKFDACSDSGDQQAYTQLNSGQIPDCLSKSFAANKMPLSQSAQVSFVTQGAAAPGCDGYWVITDPNSSNPPATDRKRYPIQQATSGSNCSLQAFEGFPVNPDLQSFNSLTGQRASKVFYPDDPSNVYHSYMRDHVKIRLLHGGGGITHVHHMHAHQWLHTPNSDNSAYLDSQMINPGSTYTLDMVYNGSGNRNQTVGDSIFHCHFYPHFAGGMWGLWRIHDVFEAGTELTKDGIPIPGWNRTLPDGEIDTGAPIPAVVPLPTLGMAPAPARTRLIDHGRRVEVEATIAATGKKTYENPGYPFFVPGVSGHRAPHPPLDFAWEEEKAGTPKLDTAGNKIYLDGGLPRHLILDGKTVREFHTRWDFTKDFVLYDKQGKPVSGGLLAFQLPEDGTEIEKAAMRAHSTRTHATLQPNGDPGNFTMNGLPGTNGAPFANPSVDDDGNAQINTRRYQAAAIQVDAVFNKKGWHFPQERVITLWNDVQPTVSGARALQPFFFRVNTGETIEFWHTNLVPDYYELDDFQVRTPTDIIGQHIHLVKFDVLASDGAANGFNYEDGTFSPDEVRKRIDAMNLMGGMHDFDPATQFIGIHQRMLRAKDAAPVFGAPPAGQNWKGAQTTIQRWDTDPLLNNQGVDRTMRTVFTHDHFGPSTHQQVGLYGGLLIEPENSKWYDPITGGLLYNTAERTDGGPTSWQANIVTPHEEESYREFALEFGDFQLAYTNQSPAADKKTGAPPTVPSAPLFNICSTIGVLLAPTPQLSCDTAQINALVASLNAGGAVSPLVHQAFARYGVTLAATAIVQVQTSGSQWQIVNPLYTPAPGQNPCGSRTAVCDTYPIALSTTANVGLQVSDPNMPSGWSDPQYAINAPADFYNSQNGGPAPTLISVVAPPGAYSLNYRNEPLPLRVYNPNSNTTASGVQGDLSHVFRSIERADTQLNQQPQPLTLIDPTQSGNPNAFKYPQNLVPTVNGAGTCDPTNSAFNPAKAEPCDPYTPLLRAYAGDNVQIRTLVGSQHNPHYFDVQGIKWLFEPSDPNSGYRNSQPMGISEHFEMLFHLPPATTTSTVPFADYLYETNASTEGLTNGTWGLMRSYSHEVDQLKPLPNNPQAGSTTDNIAITPPPGANVKTYNVVATTAAQALPGGTLVYNSRGQVTSTSPLQFNQQLLIEDPYAILYVLADDLDGNGKWKYPSRRVEPLILRAAAGDWLQINLINAVDPTLTTFTQQSAAQSPFGQAPLPTINLQTSTSVGLQPQRVSFDMTQANGTNAGFNPIITAAPGAIPQPVYWYAGNISVKNGKIVTTPVELGGINLLPSDPMEQHPKGLVGALIVEPRDSTWQEDVNSHASATVTHGDKKFREFVVITEDDATVYSGTQNGQPAPYASFTLNYGAEAMPYRYPLALSANGGFNSAAVDISEGTSDQLVQADPQTPLFVASAGTPVRFHMLHPSGGPGNTDGNVYTISGHVWQEEPYTHGSREIGYNPLSQSLGTRGNHGARDHFEIVLDSAGGVNKVAGDYLYRSLLVALGGGDMQSGLWGIFRVSQPGKDAVVITNAQPDGQQLTVNGTATVNPDTGSFAEHILLVSGTLNPESHDCKGTTLGFAPIQPFTGLWSYQVTVTGEIPTSICAQSVPYGGAYAWTLVKPLLRAVPPVQLHKKPVPNIVRRLKQTAQKEDHKEPQP